MTLIFGVFFQKQVSFAARNYEQAVWNMLNRGMWSVEVFTVLESISVIVLDFYGLEHFGGGSDEIVRHYSGRFVRTTARTGVLALNFPKTLKIGSIRDVNLTNINKHIISTYGLFRFLRLY